MSAISYITYAGAGVQTDFIVTFPYISQSHVFVTVAGVSVAFTWLNSTTIRTLSAPTGLVKIYRQTPQSALVVFNDGSTLVASDLNVEGKQAIYISQEASDIAADSAVVAGDLVSFIATTTALNNSALVSATSATLSQASATLSASSASTNAAIASSSASSAASSSASASTSASSASTNAGIATTQAGIATTAATTLNSIASNSALSTIGNDLSGGGFPYDLGTITEPAVLIGVTPTGNIVTVASNIASVNAVANNMATVITASSAATNAATSASNASASATAASGSATTASSASSALTTALASFRAKYLGALSSDPTVDGNGTSLTEGAEYFNSVSNKMRVYADGAWGDYDASVQSAITNASLSASSAAGSASSALTQAGVASASASTATTQASNASASALSASNSASASSTSATNASNSATSASNSATSAASSASSAIAALAAASGSVSQVTASSPVVSSGGASPNISMPLATASASGYLSSLDWASFNGKQTALGFTPYNSSNPSSYISQAGISALPLSQLASTLDLGTVP